jgi:hypothetical protein
MKATIVGRVRNSNPRKDKAILPLFEAVISAFQALDEAGGTGQKISIHGEIGA